MTFRGGGLVGSIVDSFVCGARVVGSSEGDGDGDKEEEEDMEYDGLRIMNEVRGGIWEGSGGREGGV